LLVAAFGTLDCFVLSMRALDCMSCSARLGPDLVDLAIDLALDGVMPILVAFMPTMGRFNGVRRAGCTIMDLVGLFIDIAFDLGELDAANLVTDVC
jgi:hypothetical protein